MFFLCVHSLFIAKEQINLKQNKVANSEQCQVDKCSLFIFNWLAITREKFNRLNLELVPDY